MTTIFKLITTLRKDLAFLFMLALLTVCVIDFWLINIPELFNGGHVLGTIIEKLCLSYISAFIFYFLVVHIKQQKDKKNIYNYVAIKSNLIIAYGQTIGRDLAKAADVTMKNYYPNKNELLEICSKVNPYSETPLLINFTGQKANWFEHFENYRIRSMDAIQEIYAKMPFLDTQLVQHLSKIENSQFFSLSKAISPYPIQFKNDTLLNFFSTIFDYINVVKNFEDYYNAKIKQYK